MAITSFLSRVVPLLSQTMLTITTPRFAVNTDGGGEVAAQPPAPAPSSRLILSAPKLFAMMKVRFLKANEYRCDADGFQQMPIDIRVPEGKNVARVRIDMPGVKMDTVSVKVDTGKNLIKFSGLEDPEGMHGIHPTFRSGRICREYSGTLVLDPNQFRAVDHVYTVLNGIFYLEITSFKPSITNDIGVALMEDKDKEKRSAHNPMATAGKDRFYYHDFTEEAFVLAIDMPGLADGDLKLFVEREQLSFYGKESQQHPFAAEEKEAAREYEGSFKVNQNELDTKGVEYVIENGVLWVTVPRVRPATQDWVTLKFGKKSIVLSPYSAFW